MPKERSVKKRRSDISKLVSHCRLVWRQSVAYQQAKKECKHPTKPGWFICPECKQEREVIQVDHIEAIGKQPDNFLEFGVWINRLFNLPQKGLCKDCHKEKTKRDRGLR